MAPVEDMPAAVLHGARDLRIERRPVPAPGPGEVLLRVDVVGVCGTDAHEYAAGARLFPVEHVHPVTGHVGPLVPGHELAGTVVDVGPGVETIAHGALVACGAGVSCGVCRWCVAGRTNLCARYHTVGIHRDGGLAGHVVVPASICAEAGALTPDTVALAQPMAIAVHAIRRGGVEGGASVLVVGAGGIGAFLVHALHARGCDVVVAERDEARVAVARALGATESVTVDADGRSSVAARSFDVVLVVTGSASGLATALHAVARGGRVVLVGLHGAERTLQLAPVSLDEIELVGTQAHVFASDLPEALRSLAARDGGWGDVAPRVLPLGLVAEEGLAPIAEGRSAAIKVLVDPWATEARAARHGTRP